MQASLFLKYTLFTALTQRNVQVKLLFNEHATHKYEMKKHLKAFMYDVKKKRRHADIDAKVFAVIWIFSQFELSFSDESSRDLNWVFWGIMYLAQLLVVFGFLIDIIGSLSYCHRNVLYVFMGQNAQFLRPI